MKPFKPPTVVGRQPLQTFTVSDLPDIPPAKKRRVDVENPERQTHKLVRPTLPDVRPVSATTQPQFRAPLRETTTTEANKTLPEYEAGEAYYAVLWRKPTNKKNKTWDGDGTLVVCDWTATLQDANGRQLGKEICKSDLCVGASLFIAGRELEISAVISKCEVLGGRRFLNSKPAYLATITQPPRALQTNAFVAVPSQVHSNGAALPGFRMPLLQSTVLPALNSGIPTPRHDPAAPGALVMKRPIAPKGKQIVDVVVDPILTKALREHQRAGVSFLYECVMGMKPYPGEGAILADEMGLGKTLQTIALIWTLLKQSPIADERPVIKKALVVCPVTLINNWRKEFRKWLPERIGVLVADDPKVRISDFTRGKAYNVMIIGYERLRSVKEDLQKGAAIDIVIADEGHRLKTAKNKSADAIKSLSTERRIILSGTPIQNDLEEFWTMVDFVNPGLLNKYSVFKREFETPILKSQPQGATRKERELGEARSKELAEITGQFILRRTAEILSKYLPPKTEYVLFCRPTESQATVYRAIIKSPMFSAALGSSSMSLELINVLKKVCNSPNLLLSKGVKGEDATKTGFYETVPTKLLQNPSSSGKLQVLDSLLHQIRCNTEDKVVLVSNYTSTMDVLGNLLTSLDYPFLRLDGQTAVSKRQELVDCFNRLPAKSSFIFLLSAKAGGVGLNLIGASRLILYDLDWNPATDLQAMARIHRDGQKKPCYIYRMLTAGALDEKIFQRQVSKTGLADSIVDGKNGAGSFTREELRNLFTLDESRECQTHKLLGCTCGGNGLLAPTEPVASVGNDTAILSERGADGIDVVHLEEGQEAKWNGGFTSSANIDIEAQEEALRTRSSADKMSSLMQYSHFDTTNVQARASTPIEDDSSIDTLEDIIEDGALRNVLREPLRRIDFILIKSST